VLGKELEEVGRFVRSGSFNNLSEIMEGNPKEKVTAYLWRGEVEEFDPL
jgi:hypothetical protein